MPTCSSEPEWNSGSASRSTSVRSWGLLSSSADSSSFLPAGSTATKGLRQLLRNRGQACQQQWDSRHLLGCQSAWRGDCFCAGGSRTSSSFRGADAQPEPLPSPGHESASLGVLRALGSSQGFPASLPPGLEEMWGMWLSPASPWVWAAGSVTSHPKALVILAPFQSPMVAEAWKQRLDEIWDFQAPLYFDGYLFPVSPSPASPFWERLKNAVSHFFPNSQTSSTMCTCQCFVVNRNSWFYLFCPGNPPAAHRSLKLHEPMHWPRCHLLKINL